MTWPEHLTVDENISRFVVQRRQIKNGPNGKYIHHSALWPDESDNYTTSVYRTSLLSEDEIWSLGDDNISNPVLARLDNDIKNIFNLKLDIDPDNSPPRHANIVNWPTDRSKCRSIAQQLSAKAEHIIRLD